MPDWQGKSLYGWVNKDGTQLKLQGPVEMHRPAVRQAPARRHAYRRRHRVAEGKPMETAAPAQIVQAGTTIRGIGMHADLNDKHLELHDDVHATSCRASASR